MAENDENVDQLMCEHRFVRPVVADGEEAPRCVSCGVGYAEYVHGTVRAALTRQGAWP